MEAASGLFRLRGDLLAVGILASLRRWNLHGYRLGRELVKAGLPLLDSATLYRTLRELERAGLVSSFWDTSTSGPARRMYSLTKAGEIFLSSWVETLQRFQAVFQRAADEVEVPSLEQPEAASSAARPSRRARTAPSGKRGGAKEAGRGREIPRQRVGAERAAS